MSADKAAGSLERAVNSLERLAFRFYKGIVSPLIHAVSPGRCLYLPTCSEYAYVAVSRFGVVRGGWLALRRVARCHPWGRGGVDPVPARQTQAPGTPSRGGEHLG